MKMQTAPCGKNTQFEKLGNQNERQTYSACACTIDVTFGMQLNLGRGCSRGKLKDGFAHFLAGFEFYDGTARDGNMFFGLIRIPSYARLPDFDFKDPEIAQFDGSAVGQ